MLVIDSYRCMLRSQTGGPPPPPPPPPPSGEWSPTRTRAVIGLSVVNDYTPPWAFLNLVKTSSRDWDAGGAVPHNDARMDANYEPANQAAGQTMTRVQWVAADLVRQDYPWIKTGTYVLKWNGAGSMNTNGISSTLINSNRREFSVGLSNTFLQLSATGPVFNIRLCHIDHEAALDAGELFNPDFVVWLQSWSNAHAIRPMDWQMVNFGNISSVSQIPTLTNISWCWERADKAGVPPELLGELGKKTNRPVWLTMHYLQTDASITEYYTRIRDRDPTGTWKVIIEIVNEAWNFGFPVSNYFINTYSQSITNINSNGDTIAWASASSQDRLNSAYGHFFHRCVHIARQVFGLSRVVPVASFQTGFPSLMWYYARYSLPGYNSGQTVAQVMNGGGGGLKGILAPTNYFYAGETYRSLSLNNRGVTRSEADWVTVWKADIDATALFLNAIRSNFTTAGLDTDVPFISYEGNLHDFIDRNSASTNAWADFYGTVDTGNNWIVMGAANMPNYDNGDKVNCPTGSPINASVGFNELAWVRRVDAQNALRLYGSQAAYDADTGNTGAGSLTLNSGTFPIGNVSRHVLLNNLQYSVMQGARGQELYEYIVSAFKAQQPLFNGPALFIGCNLPRFGENSRFTASFNHQNRGQNYGSTEAPIVEYLKGLNT